jgi:16S rRNA (cytosine967-C5)-methyltransferase
VRNWSTCARLPAARRPCSRQSGARVIACDSNESRLERLRSTVQRLGVAERVEVLATDAGEALGTRTFDGVLVDAPCSNTGVLAQRPEARWRFGPASRAELAAIQTRLIDRAAELVRPGGRLVWSTCSIEPEENRAHGRRVPRAPRGLDSRGGAREPARH